MRAVADRTLAGRYRLEKQVGQGGMGAVWQARDTVLGRSVAVKFVDPGGGARPGSEVRLRREARALGGLSHPQLARVYDLCEADGDTFIVMELVDGESLAARLAREGRPEPAEAARTAMLCADALAAAHRAGIVHRDVKPSNVMLTGHSLKVIDFGIAASLEPSDTTATVGVLGTAAYLAPERAAGAQATSATDVYSLGVVLYQMLAGRLPFEAEESIAMLYAHATATPEPLPAAVPPALAGLCLALLAKDPAKRPDSATAAAALRHPALLDPRAAPRTPVRERSYPDRISTPAPPAPALPRSAGRRPSRRVLLPAGTVLALAGITLGVWLASGTGTPAVAAPPGRSASSTAPASPSASSSASATAHR